MKRIIGLIYIFHFAFVFSLSGQNSILLTDRRRPSKTTKLSLDRIYIVKTDTAKFKNEKVIGVTDTSLQVLKRVRTGDSSMYITKFKNPSANDTTYYPEYRNDTLEIPFRQIVYLERNLFRNARWVEPFLWLSFGGVGALALAPIVAIAEGPDDGLQCLKIGGAILGVTLPVIFVASRTVTYDMKNKWTFLKINATTH